MKTVAVLALALVACGGARQEGGAQYPAREEGCAVELFRDAPTKPSANIGPVNASCDETVAEAECIRTLKDQVCKLGGDIVWGVDPEPLRKNGRQQWSGRAAHTK
ncbi:hypothetical protein LZC95_44155 [Pendulispora brunnea]|uniref:Uncharacterized protein n=1 Tax=Pendulispora brunnea TaxID=2905690 RepID=A0ABZ2K408_9BACT